MLHITNGDCAVDALARGGIPRENILPWRDVLHEGPVPADLALDALSGVRAGFLAQSGCGEYEVLRASFAERDLRLAGARSEDEVVLWFESDVYDQLQLLQVLDWFADQRHRPGQLTKIEVDRSPADGCFEGLGRIDAARVHQLLAAREAVTDAALGCAVASWAAFRASSPEALVRRLAGARDAHAEGNAFAGLPHLHDALLRLLAELPHPVHGLARTEWLTLRLLQDRWPQNATDLFAGVQAAEPRPFLGDTWYWRMLARLADGPQSLMETTSARIAAAVSSNEASWTLTAAGRRLLSGALDAIDAIGIDRWWGGTRLWTGGTIWCWDGAQLTRRAPMLRDA